jgi:threonine dehydratase
VTAPARTIKPLTAVSLAEVFSARDRLRGITTRTPLIRLNVDVPGELYLKLESLQPVGSFKLRGAANAMLTAGNVTRRGVYTVSAGNMAQGLAWAARMLGVPCTCIVPEHAPATKLDAILRLGGKIEKVPFDVWYRVFMEHRYEGIDAHFIHPVSNTAVMAGNATIALELLEDLPEFDEVIVPFGGGGLSCGIAAALRGLRPTVRVNVSECELSAPLAAALAAGEPALIEYVPSFVDGIGGKQVLPEMWPLIQSLIGQTILVSLDATASAVRLLAERARVIAEGAAATAVAAGLQRAAARRRIICIVSGGNIDTARLQTILAGHTP